MDSIKNYLISVIAAAIISGIATSIVGKKGTVGSVTKLITGLFLIITVISPWKKLPTDALSKLFPDDTAQASDVVAHGEITAKNEMAAIIKSQLEAYILDKASLMDLDIEVQITMSGTQPPTPESVAIKGVVAPYGKQRLEQILCNDLGIAKENQFWT